jgi:hypothetical protein
LAAGSVEGEHQLAAQAFAVRVPAGAPKEIKLTDALGTVLGTWTP